MLPPTWLRIQTPPDPPEFSSVTSDPRLTVMNAGSVCEETLTAPLPGATTDVLVTVSSIEIGPEPTDGDTE